MIRTRIDADQLAIVAQGIRARHPSDIDWERLPFAGREFWLVEAQKILRPAGIEVTR